MYTLNSNNFNQGISSPLDQFEVRDLLFIDIPILENLHLSLTNIGFFLTIGALYIIILNINNVNYIELVDGGVFDIFGWVSEIHKINNSSKCLPEIMTEWIFFLP